VGPFRQSHFQISNLYIKAHQKGFSFSLKEDMKGQNRNLIHWNMQCAISNLVTHFSIPLAKQYIELKGIGIILKEKILIQVG